jgi:predicted acyl esterase
MTAVDGDVAVKVTDVFPTGESMLVQDGILRLRWRDGPFSTSPSLLTPNMLVAVNVSVGFMSYVFNPLHSIRVSIAGSNFPRFSSNTQDGSPVNATGATNVTSTVSVFGAYEGQGIGAVSALYLPTLPLQTLLDMRV